jgi:membrane protein YdbS with pleckstrin-like domain
MIVLALLSWLGLSWETSALRAPQNTSTFAIGLAAILLTCPLSLTLQLMIFSELMACLTERYTLTTDRLIHRGGILNKHEKTIPLPHAQNVSYSGLWFLGKITVESAGELYGRITLHGVRDPKLYYQMILQRVSHPVSF